MRKSAKQELSETASFGQKSSYYLNTIGLGLVATLKSIFNPYSRFPILTWIPKYNLAKVQKDIIAGINVGMTLIPQSLAYSQQAGLSPYYGLYASFMPPVIYTLMGGSKDITNGPTAIMSMLVSTFSTPPANATLELNEQYAFGTSPTKAILLSFSVGIALLSIALLQLGWIAGFISHVIIEAFIQASSITIAVSQLKKITGQTKIDKHTFQGLYGILSRLNTINWTDFIVGVSCLICLQLLRMLKDYCNDWETMSTEPHDQEKDVQQNYWIQNRKLVKHLKFLGWLTGNLRNAIVTAIAGGVAYAYRLDEFAPTENTNVRNITLTGHIPAGLPDFQAPKFTETYLNADGVEETESLGSILGTITPGIVICSIVGFLESYAISKSFASKEGYTVKGEQEMYAIGACSFFNSFVQGFPVTGSFGRSSINHACGVATPLSGLILTIMVILSLLFLTPLFYWIPTASLGAVIILAALGMFRWADIKHGVMHGIVADRIIFVITFVVCLYETMYGIIAGVALQILLIIGQSAFPKLSVNENSGVVKIKVLESKLQYPSLVKLDRIKDEHEKDILLLDLSDVRYVDNSAADGLIKFCNNLPESALLNAQSQVAKILLDLGISEEKLKQD